MAVRRELTIELHTRRGNSTTRRKAALSFSQGQKGRLQFRVGNARYELAVAHLDGDETHTTLRIQVARRGQSTFDVDATSRLERGKKTLLAKFERSAKERMEIFVTVD